MGDGVCIVGDAHLMPEPPNLVAGHGFFTLDAVGSDPRVASGDRMIEVGA